MPLVDQWNTIERGLDPRWADAQVALTVDTESHLERAAALLAPAGPVRSGRVLRFYAARSGPGVGPEAVRRMLARIDAEGLEGSLELVGATETVTRLPVATASLADAWDAALAVLPADWSDLLCELVITSSDHLDVTALRMGPVNPLRDAPRLAYRFRVAHTFGYGASAGMVRRCLERVDADEIPGTVQILRALSDTHPVGTQGPVWYIDGKAV